MECTGETWLSAQEVEDGIWRVSDNGLDNMYLVAGRERALVIDTGWGIEDLAERIGRITPLPFAAALTHGHPDHALGNDAFDTVYASRNDILRFTDSGVGQMREFVKRAVTLDDPGEMIRFEGTGTHAKVRDLELADGMRFDLGGRTVTALWVPGHTADGYCYLDDKTRVLFAGDSFIPDSWGPAWFHLPESAPLARFHESMGRLAAAKGFERLLSGHGEEGLIPAGHLSIFLEGVKGIIDGKLAGVPETTFAGGGLRCDWEHSGVLYDSGKIR